MPAFLYNKIKKHSMEFPTFIKFDKLKPENANFDFQIHTNWTDGSNSSAEIISEAEKKGLNAIAFTEHIRVGSTYFGGFYDEINDLRKNAQVKVYIGIEAKVIDENGNIDVSPANYSKAEIVLGSVHRVNIKGEFVPIKNMERKEAFEWEYIFAKALIQGGNIDVLAHPGGMSFKYFQEIPEFFIDKIIKAISETNTAYELNSKYNNSNTLEMMIYYCKKYNPYVSIGSDVHQVSDIGTCYAAIKKFL